MLVAFSLRLIPQNKPQPFRIPSWIASEGLMGKDQKYDPDHITAPEDSVTDKNKNQSSSVVLTVLD